MLINLKFNVEFASTGKKLSGNDSFGAGLSAITGKNEAGKSLRLELTRYCLFGTAALRASITSYKSLEATLTFKVLDKEYVVTRGLRKVLLSQDGKEIATGTTPVNLAIQKLFGYDLEVFDVANACLQGQVEAMTEKTPAERKKMVDRTIGLDGIDDVIKKVNEDISVNKKTIEFLENKTLTKFEEPVKPKSEKPLSDLITSLEEMSKRKQFILGSISAATATDVGIYEPRLTPLNPIQWYKDKLTELEVKKSQLASKEQTLTKIKNIQAQISSSIVYDITLVRKYIEEDYATKWLNYKVYTQSAVAKPVFDANDLSNLAKCIEIEEHNARPCEEVTCPSCAAEFSITQDKKHFVRQEQNGILFDDLCYKVGLRNGSKATIPAIKKALNDANYELTRYFVFSEKPVVEQPDIEEKFNQPKWLAAKTSLDELLAENSQEELEKEISNFRENYDKDKGVCETALQNFALEEKERADHLRKAEAYAKYVKMCDDFAEELSSISDCDERLTTLKTAKSEWDSYEINLNTYQVRMEAQRQALEDKKELEDKIILLTKIKKSLNEIKPKVKTFLLPSLNQVSSQILSQMTNGQRSKIVVDDNFDIVVDGQPVNTLSGSGKAVANLAVRIALGTVLTNKVFSVFLADEIDAAMDSERAESTAQCLQNLTKTFSQIILVSHKQPESDNTLTIQ